MLHKQPGGVSYKLINHDIDRGCTVEALLACDLQLLHCVWNWSAFCMLHSTHKLLQHQLSLH